MLLWDSLDAGAGRWTQGSSLEKIEGLVPLGSRV